MITGKYPSLRLRRTRKEYWSRKLFEENTLSSSDFILPIFLMDGKNKKEEILSMPDVYRYSINRIAQIVDKAIENKIPMVALFPKINNKLKNDKGTEALNHNNLVCKGILEIKKKYKNQIGIMCDVALDPYTSHGHDGLLKSNVILNDETIELLIKQSILQAQMGCDVIAPSDMMDGRVGYIRNLLDEQGFEQTSIMAYTAKYASSYYGPFREALGSSPKGDRSTYQMDFRNHTEALRELELDLSEGADMVMVKPALAYLDVIRAFKERSTVPTSSINRK